MTRTDRSRRQFVAGAAASAVIGSLAMAAAVKTGKIAAPAATPAKPDLTELHRWEKMLKDKFRIVGETGAVIATLAMIVPLPADPGRPRATRSTSFYVYFKADPRHSPLKQQIYTVVHPLAGTMPLFLSRAEDRNGRAILTALFN